MNVFDLFAKISLDTKDYEESLESTEKKTASFSSSIGGGIKKAAKVGTAAVGTIAAASSLAAKKMYQNAKETAQYGDSIDKMSQKVGMSTDAYQEWDYVMQLSGTSMQESAAGFKTFTNKIDEAAKGSEKSIKMFEQIGISMEDIQKYDRETLFKKAIKGFQNMSNETERAALASDLLGRAGMSLQPVFNMTNEELEGVIQEAHDYGAVMSKEAVKQSATFNDRLTRLNKAFSGVKNTISSNFMPGITQVIEGFADLIEGNDGATKSLDEGFNKTIESLADNVPKILEVGERIIVSLVSGIVDNTPKLIETGTNVVITLVKSLIQVLVKSVPVIIKEIPSIIKTIVVSIGDAFGVSALELLPVAFAVPLGSALTKGLMSASGASGIKEAVKLMFTGPQGIVTAVAAGAVLLTLAVQESFNESYEKAREGASKLTDVQQGIVDKLRDEAKEWDEIKQRRIDAAKEVEETVGSYKALWERLTEIVDEQGKVKKGYEEEAQQITGELSTALGIEIKLTDGQISNYKELQKQIDLAIAKKKAELMLRAFEDDYVQAQKKRVQATNAQAEAENELIKATQEQKDAEKELKKATDILNEAKAYGAGAASVYGKSISELTDDVYTAQGKFDGATEKVEIWTQAIEDADVTIKESDRTISNYDRTMTAAAKGGIADIDTAVTYMSRSIKTAKESSEDELKAQTAAFIREWKTQEENAKKYGDEFSKAEAASAKKAVDVAIKELGKLSPEVATQLKIAIKTGKGLDAAWEALGENSAKGIASGFKGATTYVTSAAKNTIKDAIAAAKKVALIASPSKLFRDEIGLNLGRGIAVGMEASEGEVRKASEELIDAASDVDTGYDYETVAVDSGEQRVGDITINVYGAEGQDVSRLAEEVSEVLQRMYKREVARFA